MNFKTCSIFSLVLLPSSLASPIHENTLVARQNSGRATSATPLTSVKETIPADTAYCYPPPKTLSSGTYGFEITAPDDMVVSLGTDSNSGAAYYQGLGSGSGSFYLEQNIVVCGDNSKGSTAADIAWNVYSADDIGSLGLPVVNGETNYPETSVATGRKCYESTGFTSLADTTYGFSYTIGADTILTMKDSSNDSIYFQGKGSENSAGTGSMYMTTANTLSICFDNQGTGADKVTFAVYNIISGELSEIWALGG